MMEIELNGTPHIILISQTVYGLIATLDLLGMRLAVAVNREVVPPQLWPQRILKELDRVEIVRAIGGG